MIFDIEPSQIEILNSAQLVILLKKLLHAEAKEASICLSGISVPLQITVPDGGEDGRIEWTGEPEKTNYLPSGLCVFQSKASPAKNFGPAEWKKEVWTKASSKGNLLRKLSKAVTNVLLKRGAYIGFTSAALTTDKIVERINGIKEGILAAQGDPELLKEININIYDANKIAAWASEYPSVSLWLNEQNSELKLRNFRTVERWGQDIDITSISHIEDAESHFVFGNNSSISKDDSLTFAKAKERVVDHLVNPKKFIRVIGSSGIGKTRFVYEVLKDESTIVKNALKTSTIYCDFRDVGDQIFQTVLGFLETNKPATIIVDECPREIATRLGNIISSDNSHISIITIGNDNQSIEENNCLNIHVDSAPDNVIEGIIKQRCSEANYQDIVFIKKVSGGNPRIAVLAADNYLKGAPILKSVEDVVERILVGCGVNRVEQVRAIECLSLFKQLGADENLSDEINFVAEKLARQTGDEMYEHLAHASKQYLVDKRSNYFTSQLPPIAAFLGARRLDLLRVNTIIDFIVNAPPKLRLSFLDQWCHFDVSRTAFQVSQRLLSPDGWCGSLEKLSTEIGSQCFIAIMHVNPDGVTNIIHHVYGDLCLDDLKEAKTKNRTLLNVLKILVARKKSFSITAPILMCLAAAEKNPLYDDSASKRFYQLFQFQWSGTETDYSARFNILDAGLESGNPGIISTCIEALEYTIKKSIYGFIGRNQIGSQPPLKEWMPEKWGEVFDFHRNGLKRLMDIRTNHKEFADKCEKTIAPHLRFLLRLDHGALFNDIKCIVETIGKEKTWFDAIREIGNWLYFDQAGASKNLVMKVEDLYNVLVPTDLVQQALLYTKFWTGTIHNPNLIFDRSISNVQDIEYSSRKAKEVASKIAEDEKLVFLTIQEMFKESLNDISSFTDELVAKSKNPLNIFKLAVEEHKAHATRGGIQFIRGLIAGIDKKDAIIADQCIKIAIQSNAFENNIMDIYTAVGVSKKRLNEVIKGINSGSITIAECAHFSYGKRLDNLSSKNICLLVDAIISKGVSKGIWTALDIIYMYKHGSRSVDDLLAQKIKSLLISPQIFEEVNTQGRDGYIFEQLIFLIDECYDINEDFAINLSNQIIRICKINSYQIFSEMDSHCRNIIKLLVKRQPTSLWKALSYFYEIATPLEINYLKCLVGSPQNTRNGESQNKEGFLFGIPYAECKKWAEIDPQNRAPFLCIFYPVFEVNAANNNSWHPALVELTHDFGKVKEFRDSLANRLSPRPWSGSRIPHLETYLEPLKTWFEHPLPEISKWAKEQFDLLEEQIEYERINEH